MAALAPVSRTPPAVAMLADSLIVELATAPDVEDGMMRVVSILRTAGCLQRVEWWTSALDRRSLRLEAASGFGPGRRTAFPVGAVGALVLVGDDVEPELAVAVWRFAAVLKRRATEEQLAAHTVALLRQNEALEDFAALVAHELKGALATALLQNDVESGVRDALALVDSILEVARSASGPEASASAARCLDEALGHLGTIAAEITVDVQGELPLPPAALSVLLRNLVANALAADARHIRVSSSADCVLVDDDGVGIAASEGYAAGSGLGFGLCRRLAARFGGVLELEARAAGGTRARFALTECET